MRVIFLDIDGELTYTGYRNEKTQDIDLEKVALLKEIVETTDAKIVLSSSWKCGYDKTTGEKKIFYRTLENILSAMGLFIYDITEDIPGIMTKEKEQPWQEDKPISLCEYEKVHFQYGTGRAAEVKKWIDDHTVESFVILDDEDHGWEDYGLADYWIQPSWYDENGGLHREHVTKAIQILKTNQLITKEEDIERE